MVGSHCGKASYIKMYFLKLCKDSFGVITRPKEWRKKDVLMILSKVGTCNMFGGQRCILILMALTLNTWHLGQRVLLSLSYIKAIIQHFAPAMFAFWSHQWCVSWDSHFLCSNLLTTVKGSATEKWLIGTSFPSSFWSVLQTYLAWSLNEKFSTNVSFFPLFEELKLHCFVKHHFKAVSWLGLYFLCLRKWWRKRPPREY